MQRSTLFTSVSLVLLVVAFAFLILGVVTLPISSSLKLGSTPDYTFGIFGYCHKGKCSSSLYPVSFGDIDKNENWLLTASTRNTLSKGFIISPISCGLVFLALIFTSASLFVQHSLIKIFSLVFGFISFVALTVTGVFVVLVFHPHVAWTGWILIAAAALALAALPCLFFSIGVKESVSQDDESENSAFGGYGKIDNDTSFTSTTLMKQNSDSKVQFNGPVTTAYGENASSFSNEYSYRGMTGGGGYDVTKNDSQTSLFNSKPNDAKDFTKQRPTAPSLNLNGSTTSFYGDLKMNMHEVPRTPISAKQKMAPHLVPNSAVTSNSHLPDNTALPYPPSESAITRLDSAKYGVFDHHPEVEGHKPFTELDDSELNDQESETLPQPQDSDDDSDFTSISQRPPNVDFPGYYQQAPQHQPYAQHYQQPYPQQAYQIRPNLSEPIQLPQQSSYYGSDGSSANRGYYQQPQGQRPPQPPQHYQQFAPQGYGGRSAPFQPRPVPQSKPHGPTISDSVLNNNPDFALGAGGRRKFVPVAARNNASNRPARSGARDGPYGMIG